MIKFKTKLEAFLTMGLAIWLILLLLQGCAGLKQSSLFKSKRSETNKTAHQASEQFRSLDYRLYSQIDSSSFGAWMWLEDGFTFHPDRGVYGERAIIQYFGNHYSQKSGVDSSLVLKNYEKLKEDLYVQDEEEVSKEKVVKGVSLYWWLVTFGGMLVLGWLVRLRNK